MPDRDLLTQEEIDAYLSEEPEDSSLLPSRATAKRPKQVWKPAPMRVIPSCGKVTEEDRRRAPSKKVWPSGAIPEGQLTRPVFVEVSNFEG